MMAHFILYFSECNTSGLDSVISMILYCHEEEFILYVVNFAN